MDNGHIFMLYKQICLYGLQNIKKLTIQSQIHKSDVVAFLLFMQAFRHIKLYSYKNKQSPQNKMLTAQILLCWNCHFSKINLHLNHKLKFILQL